MTRKHRCRADVWVSRQGFYQCTRPATTTRSLPFEARTMRTVPVCGTHGRAANPTGYLGIGVGAQPVEEWMP